MKTVKWNALLITQEDLGGGDPIKIVNSLDFAGNIDWLSSSNYGKLHVKANSKAARVLSTHQYWKDKGYDTSLQQWWSNVEWQTNKTKNDNNDDENGENHKILKHVKAKKI